MASPLGTLHYFDHNLEVHRVVVGSYANNVFIVRCKHTGDAVLIDAANEHERLLELCTALGVRRVLETHGHHDHIQAVPAMREAGYEVAVMDEDAEMLKDVGYDVFISDTQVFEVGKLRLEAIHNPGTHSRFSVVQSARCAAAFHRRHIVSWRPWRNALSRQQL
jgi:glyoxylase-like metal-dependent hydrolase (beta-lactamase superfamily II)